MKKLDFYSKREESLEELYAWADSFTEFGQSNTVGANVIGKIKDKIDAAYEKGFKEGVRSQRSLPSSTLRRRPPRRKMARA